MKPIRAAGVQFEHAPSDRDSNWRTIETFVQRATQQGVQILAFPECCIAGYWHLRKLSRAVLVALAEPVFDGPSSQCLSALARETGITIDAGLVEIDADGTPYNTYVGAMPDGQFTRHRKCTVSSARIWPLAPNTPSLTTPPTAAASAS